MGDYLDVTVDGRIATLTMNRPHKRNAMSDGLLAEFDASRVRAAAYVASLDVDRLTLTGEYPGFGTFAAADFVYEWPFHDHEHLRQILDITKAVYLPSMSETMRTALQDSND